MTALSAVVRGRQYQWSLFTTIKGCKSKRKTFREDILAQGWA